MVPWQLYDTSVSEVPMIENWVVNGANVKVKTKPHDSLPTGDCGAFVGPKLSITLALV